MRILLIQFISTGGIQVYTSQLANALSKTDHEVFVLLGDYLYDACYYDTQRVNLIKIKAAPSYFWMLRCLINPKSHHKVVQIINEIRPDVIHLMYDDIFTCLIAYRLRARYTIVYTDHDPVLHEGIPLASRLHHTITKLITKRFDSIIVHGRQMEKVLINEGVAPDKVHVLPLGEFSIYNRWKNPTTTEEKSILFFGKIRKYKGIEYLIEAEPSVTAAIPDAKIVIAGEGNFEEYMHLIKSKDNFELNIRHIPDEEVALFFQKASVVVLPYTGGSQSGVIPIAYSFGKPVVATNVGSVAEVVEDGKTGFIVPPRDSVALANAIIKIVNDDDLRYKMSENAYQKAQTELSWDSIAKKTAIIYQKARK